MTVSNISLSEALKTGRLQDFIAQQEAPGMEPVKRRQFDAAVKKFATAPKPQDQTSGSRAPDGSTGKENSLR